MQCGRVNTGLGCGEKRSVDSCDDWGGERAGAENVIQCLGHAGTQEEVAKIALSFCAVAFDATAPQVESIAANAELRVPE